MYALVKTAALKSTLKDYQDRVRNKMMNQPGLVVAHGTGTGKTISSIATLDTLGKPTTVIVPAALRENYRKELIKHLGYIPENIQIKSVQQVARNKNPEKTGLLIVDEAHKIRNPGITTGKIFAKYPAEKRMLLTGSSQYNTPSDLAHLINIASGEKTLPTGKEFEKHFIETRKISPGIIKSILGKPKIPKQFLTNTKELSHHVHKWVDYHENPLDNSDFPSFSEETVKVPMTGKQTRVYNTIFSKAPAWVRFVVKHNLPAEKKHKDLNAFLAGARQVSNSIGSYDKKLTEDTALEHAPKIQKAFNMFKEELDKNPRHKAIIYSNYLHSALHPYSRLLTKHGVPHGLFTGEQPRKMREQMVRDYNEGKLKALLLSSAGVEGLDTKGTRQVQSLEPHWNNEKIKQVKGRAIRYKSHMHLPLEERHVKIQHFQSEPLKTGLAVSRLWNKSSPGVDSYIQNRADDKDFLMHQMYALMKGHTTKTSSEKIEKFQDFDDFLCKCAARAKKDYSTIQQHELQLWQDWKTSGEHPEKLEPILDSMAPLIQQQVNVFRGVVPIPESAIKANMQSNVVKALQNFNPQMGASLSTHVRNTLKKSKRFIGTYQNTMRIPEGRIFDIGEYRRAVESLNEQLGRFPTDKEVSEHMGISEIEAKRHRKERRITVASSSFEDDPSAYDMRSDKIKEALHFIYYELSPEERDVYDYIYGTRGKQKLSPGSIARVLKISASKVSRVKNAIAEKLKRYGI